MPKQKTPAQLHREVVELLAASAVPDAPATPTSPAPALGAKSHSAKALSTLAIMGTAPSQWRLTPIDWVREEREVRGSVTCPTCRGEKFVRIEGGRVLPPPEARSDGGSDRDSRDYHSAARRDALQARMPYGNCPTCARRRRGWGMIPQGKVDGMVRTRVMVGYPRFPPGTRFDSRFFAGAHCNLCNKLVMKSRRVPVHATGNDGVAHGMFVGEDCARKFLGVTLRREGDSILETGNGPPDLG